MFESQLTLCVPRREDFLCWSRANGGDEREKGFNSLLLALEQPMLVEFWMNLRWSASIEEPVFFVKKQDCWKTWVDNVSVAEFEVHG